MESLIQCIQTSLKLPVRLQASTGLCQRAFVQCVQDVMKALDLPNLTEFLRLVHNWIAKGLDPEFVASAADVADVFR